MSQPKRRPDGTFLESGNKNGRPRKQRGGQKVDVTALLYTPMPVRDGKGVVRDMSPLEIALRRHLAKARKNTRSAAYLLDQFVKYGAIARLHESDGVVVCPAGVPIEAARALVERYGRPPWSKRQIDAAMKQVAAKAVTP